MTRDERVANGFKAFKNWYADFEPKVKAVEMLVYHPVFEYVGTLDLWAVVQGRDAIIDFKCSKALYPTVALQTAAQAACLVNEGLVNKDTVERYALRLCPETGMYEFKYLEHMERDFSGFVHALELSRKMKDLELTDFARKRR